MFDDNNEVVHRHEVPGSASSRKSEVLPQLGLYILGSPLNLTNRRRARIGGSTNKVDRFEYLGRDLVITRPTLSTSAEVCPFLKYGVHRRILLASTAAAHDTLHEMFYRFSIVRCGSRVPPLVPISPRQNTINKDSTMFCGHKERHKDSIIPKDQYTGRIRFSTRLEVLGDLITIQVGLRQGL